MRDPARSKRLDEILGIAPPLPRPDPRDIEREQQRDEAMVEVVEAETLEAELARPTLSARKTLKSKVDEQADLLAAHAVAGALQARGKDAVSSVKTLLDVADSPEPVQLPSLDEIESMTFAELTIAVKRFAPERYAEHVANKQMIEART